MVENKVENLRDQINKLDDELLDIRLAAIHSLGQLRYNKSISQLSDFIINSNYDEEILASIISWWIANTSTLSV